LFPSQRKTIGKRIGEHGEKGGYGTRASAWGRGRKSSNKRDGRKIRPGGASPGNFKPSNLKKLVKEGMQFQEKGGEEQSLAIG